MPYSNPQKKKVADAIRHALNREKHREWCRVWRVQNPEKYKAQRVSWRKRNPQKCRDMRRRQREKSPGFRLSENLRRRILHALNKGFKSAHTVELLGGPICWLEVHLESLFRSGMTWENYGPVWHVDHIRPCAKFDLTDHDQQRACFHWTNLQPLFAKDNLQKNAKFQ